MTRRHDDAVAALDAADRALLSLSLTRGLDDARIAQLTGLAREAIEARHERILATVAAQLGILPDQVPAALRADGEPRRLSPIPPPAAALTVHAPRSSAPAAASPDPPGSPGRRRSKPAAILLGLVALAVVILMFVTDGGPSRHRAPRIQPTRTPSSATSPLAAAAVAAQQPESLRPVAGGPRRASGTLTLSRRNETLILVVRVRHLPILHHGHYTAYLYDSILRSRPLGLVRPHGVTRLRLPATAARYREIDVSDQARGEVNPSGESRLRGPNPARADARAARRSRSSAPSTR